MKKSALRTWGVLTILVLLVCTQIKAWKGFDWQTFWRRTDEINIWYVLLALIPIYSLYFFRAVRWRIFLKPIRRTTASRLIAPQIIGFTGLALMGRPGEVIRPLLVARKEDLSLSSQIAVLLVERLFDMGSLAIIFVVGAFVGDPLWADVRLHGSHPERTLHQIVQYSAVAFLVTIVALSVLTAVLYIAGDKSADFVSRTVQPLSASLAHRLRIGISTFSNGLHIVRDLVSFLQLLVLSLFMWLIGLSAYWLVIQAYGGQLAQLGLVSILLLMVGGMFGSLLQLPGLGGGSQLASIALLNKLFMIDGETAVSCGILLWLVTFMSVIPLGLALAHHEHISLREVSLR